MDTCISLNDEVFFLNEDVIALDQRSIGFVTEKALQNKRGRARICAHKNPEDSLHEMVIAIRSDSYICPHRHLGKVESFHLIEGKGEVVLFNEKGEVIRRILLSKKDNFYYRLNASLYHTVLIHSPILVIHETTNGPFSPPEFAPFAPLEGASTTREYIKSLQCFF